MRSFTSFICFNPPNNSGSVSCHYLLFRKELEFYRDYGVFSKLHCYQVAELEFQPRKSRSKAHILITTSHLVDSDMKYT